MEGSAGTRQKPVIVLMGGMVLKACLQFPILYPLEELIQGKMFSVLTTRKGSVSHEQLTCFLTYEYLEFCYLNGQIH